jgi:hypothetical protein
MKLHEIQKQLKAPKSQYNSFGKYYYRNAEDILEAVKPLLGDSILTLSDEVVQVGNRNYVKATAVFQEPVEIVEGEDVKRRFFEPTIVTAYACEAEDRKGMDASQITGAASSYARKYALNGLFLIDDTKDADSAAPTEDAKPAQTRQTAPQRKPFAKPEKDPATEEKARKDRIITLLRKLELPCKTKKECEDSVFTATGLMLEPENYEQIGEALAKELTAEEK